MDLDLALGRAVLVKRMAPPFDLTVLHRNFLGQLAVVVPAPEEALHLAGNNGGFRLLLAIRIPFGARNPQRQPNGRHGLAAKQLFGHVPECQGAAVGVDEAAGGSCGKPHNEMKQNEPCAGLTLFLSDKWGNRAERQGGQ